MIVAIEQNEIPQVLAAQQEFAAALRERGIVVDGLPEMDGDWHRAATSDDKPGKESATYMASLEGSVPHGVINNFRTGERVQWAHTGEQARELTQEEREQIKQQRQNRAEKKAQEWEERSQWINKEWRNLPWAQDSHGYLQRKGIENHGLKLDRHNNLVMPLEDINGKLWSVQRISAEGDKLFTKGGRTQGCFCVVGDEDARKPVVIAEGYATASSIYENTGLPVVCALNAGNLEGVARAYREKFPDRPIFIAGDNDHVKEADGKPNVGKDKSMAAANAVGGHTMLPDFRRDNRGTDWNDLAASEGKGAVLAQISQRMTECGIAVKVAPYRDLREYLDVPFANKDTAKDLGARYDTQAKQWYIPSGTEQAAFAPWFKDKTVSVVKEPTARDVPKPTYLNVPFREKDEAKQLGALWDKEQRSWYVPANVASVPFAKWVQPARERQEERQQPAQSATAAPRHDLNKNQAQMHVVGTERLAENVESLKKHPALADRTAEALATLAYFRGLVQESMQDQPQAVKDALLARFDKAAEDPATLARLEKADAPAQGIKAQNKEQRQERKDTYEHSL
jgi:phage/plasmid primase-like uncharacterized protein